MINIPNISKIIFDIEVYNYNFSDLVAINKNFFYFKTSYYNTIF